MIVHFVNSVAFEVLDHVLNGVAADAVHTCCVCSLPSMFHGDPRDYAWGADGLDNAITQVSLVTVQLTVDYLSG